MLERVWRFIGSVKLAIPLLSSIVGILIWATFYESQVGSTTVQQEIYQSPWFGGLMFLLAVNLGISAINRYPWRGARKIGFALTHLGLIVIIAGSAAVIHLGTEGMLLVRTDRPASDRLRVEGDLIEVMTPDGEIQQSNIFVRQDRTVNPNKFAGLELAGYTENAIQTVDFVENGIVDNPAVKLSLKSDRMGQTLTRSLAIAPAGYSKLSLGLAELEIVKADKDKLQQLLSPPQENPHPWGSIEVVTATNSNTIDVLETKSQPAQIKDLQIEVLDFFPDFRLDKNNFPTTASQQFNNPAVLLEVASDRGIERWFVFSKADLPPVHTVVAGENIKDLRLNYQVQPPTAQDYFKVIVAENNQLYYAAKSSQGFKSGSIAVGETITPGWADFQITLEAFIPHAQIYRQTVPVEDSSVRGTPALLVKTRSQTATWLPWGEPTTIKDSNGEIFAAFTPKLIQIPFGIKLEDFIVDRNEGSESVAMWTSKIRIEDKANGVIEPRQVWMNHPTWYRGWKIAQASWNPGDLQQSTLQVKREPTWVTALTWIGSALVVLGIAVMFYAPALTRKLRQKSTAQKLAMAEEKTSSDSKSQELTTIS